MTMILQDINIGTNLQKLRKAQSLTQEQVCAQMAILGRPMSRSTYSQIEIGKRNIFASDLITLKKIFKTSYDELFKGLIPINKYENENKE